MKPPRVGIQALCLAALVLTLFYPALNAPLNPMDDRAIVQWLYNMEGHGVWDFFAHTTGNYYRPVLMATYLLDMRLWGAEASFMHLENVLLHAANVLLVFLCARIVSRRLLPKVTWLPLLAALLFAIHPVNTEAVNWIAGRSDLLACFFVLVATSLLLWGIATGRPFCAYLSILSLAPGFFSKETAVFFVPAALVIILCDNGPLGNDRLRLIERVKSRLPFLLPYLVLPLLYLVVRGLFLLSRDTGLGLAMQFITNRHLDLGAMVQTSLMGLGFYTKKLVAPLPLNFTIFQVPDYYFWVGLFLLPVLGWFVWRRDLIRGLFLASFCLGFSAILAMLLRPAWTPVAERYLYIPSAFFCVAATIAGARLLSRIPCQQAVPMVLVIFFSATAYATVDRNLVWQDNISLFEDAVRKAPDFPFARSVLADLLIEAGRVEEGKAMIRTNEAPEGLRNADFLDLKRAQLLFAEGRNEEARILIIEKRRKDSLLYHTFQKLLAKVDYALLGTLTDQQLQEIYEEIIAVHLELYQAYQDPFYHYRLGQIYLRKGDRESAARHFRLAFQTAPDGAHYKAAAAKLADKLSKP